MTRRLPLAALCTSLSTLTSLVHSTPCWADDGAAAGSASMSFGTIPTQGSTTQQPAAQPGAPTGALPLTAQPAAPGAPGAPPIAPADDAPPIVLQAVPPTQLIGPGLLPHHYD